MTVLYESSLFAIVLTLGAYEIGRIIQKKTKWTVANPLLIAIVLIVVVLKALQIDNAKYQENVSLISFFSHRQRCAWPFRCIDRFRY